MGAWDRATQEWQPPMIAERASLARQIRERIGENVSLCSHCMKCTSGCPLAEHFDLMATQVIRALQLGQDDLVLNSRAIWLCAGCQTCTTRCPEGLDLARIMDDLVMQARERHVPPKVPEAALFHKAFLRQVDLLGRAYELGLIAEMNLRTRQPLKDAALGLRLIRKGKLRLLPDVPFPRRDPAQSARPGQLAYYPGCSLRSVSSEFNESALEVCRALGLDLVEPAGWTCCGSSAAHRSDHLKAASLPLRNLALMAEAGFEEVLVPCAACFSRFRCALHDVHERPQLRSQVEDQLGHPVRDEVRVWSLPDLLVEKVGLEAIATRVKQPLAGLKVVAYYGCLLTRPPAITGAVDHEYPTNLDRILRALGARVLDWSFKTDCCGGSLSLTQTPLALNLSRRILNGARAVGADLVAVACPLCHANLDMRQAQMRLGEPLPILYITQLMGVAFGLDPRHLALGKNLVDPQPLLAERGLTPIRR